MPETTTFRAQHLLVAVEDSRAHELFALLACRRDLAIVQVDNGAAALRALTEQGGFDLIVAEVELPDMSGLDLCRAAERSGGLPVLLVGAEHDGDVRAAFDAGAADVMLRPTRGPELSARIRRVLAAHGERSERASSERRLTSRFKRLSRRRDELEKLVAVDVVTGIVTRRTFDEIMQREARRAQRDASSLAAVLLDVDFFHEYNERFGHLAGDVCLARVAAALARVLRRSADVVGRYGGDEFMVLLPRTDAAGARVVAERMRESVVHEAIPHDSPTGKVVTVSLGVGAVLPTTGAAEVDLLASADSSLLEAKRRGRNQSVGPVPAHHGDAGEAEWPTAVRVDPSLAGRLSDVLEGKRNAVRLLSVAVGACQLDRPAALALASDLRQLGRRVGLDVVARLATRLERAVRGSDLNAIERVTDELREYLARVPVVYLRG